MKANKRVQYPVIQIKSSFTSAKVITPSDTVDLDDPIEGFMVTDNLTTLKVTMLDGDKIVLQKLLPGVVYNLMVKKIWSTGTDNSAQIIGLNSSF